MKICKITNLFIFAIVLCLCWLTLPEFEDWSFGWTAALAWRLVISVILLTSAFQCPEHLIAYACCIIPYAYFGLILAIIESSCEASLDSINQRRKIGFKKSDPWAVATFILNAGLIVLTGLYCEQYLFWPGIIIILAWMITSMLILSKTTVCAIDATAFLLAINYGAALGVCCSIGFSCWKGVPSPSWSWCIQAATLLIGENWSLQFAPLAIAITATFCFLSVSYEQACVRLHEAVSSPE